MHRISRTGSLPPAQRNATATVGAVANRAYGGFHSLQTGARNATGEETESHLKDLLEFPFPSNGTAQRNPEWAHNNLNQVFEFPFPSNGSAQRNLKTRFMV